MKVQICLFRKSSKSKPQHGIAFLSIKNDMQFIVDENGQRRDDVY